MYSRTRSLQVLYNKFCNGSSRNFHESVVRRERRENPIKRTLRILGSDLMRTVQDRKTNENDLNMTMVHGIPRQVDVLVIGGGAVGSSVAYWLKERAGVEGISVAVVEKDHTYKQCTTALSVGGLRQQFSLPENIKLSLFGAEFIRTLKKRFGPDADVYFTPHGYLVLASEAGAQQLMDNSRLQQSLGAINKIAGKEELKRRFPWLNVDDVELGCLGLEKEGWFDPWAMLSLLKRGAIQKGAQFIDGEVVGFDFADGVDIEVEGLDYGTYQGINGCKVRLPTGEEKVINFAYCVLAAGSESGKIAEMAKVGTGPGMLSVALPVERRKRYVYCFDCQGDGPTINTPLTIDYTGTYFRRDGFGGSYIGGLSPNEDEEPSTDNLEVDHKFFEERVWPNLANRIPAFNSIKVRSSWAGYYDYNFYDQNGIVGQHPYYQNLIIATGFSGHGIQQAPGVGRAVAELMLDGDFQTIDLTRFSYDRLMVDQPMLEANIF